MADHSHIEWTDATWNPVTGCSIVSPGCTNCYAMKLAGTRLRNHPSRAGLTTNSKAGPVWNGSVRFNEQWLTQPLEWRKPRMIFVCAHGDLFHEDVPDEWIDKVFAVMALAPQHTFQVLTKRAKRMRDYMANIEREALWMNAVADLFEIDCSLLNGRYPIMGQRNPWLPLPNVWLGVSTERQQEADERIPLLLETPAAVRFISAEPLLGPIDLTKIGKRYAGTVNALRGIWASLPMGETGGRAWIHTGVPVTRLDWVIVGGESGPDSRPMHPDWARSLRDQCKAAGVPFFFKQWGAWAPRTREEAQGELRAGYCHPEGRGAKWPRPEGVGEYGPAWLEENGFAHVARIGKKAAGRLLDGVEHNGMPERAA
jgi:protein gp37